MRTQWTQKPRCKQPMDSNPQRHCTVPKIFGFRKWFESRYGDLCEAHDGAYERGDCRLCADWTFIKVFVTSHRGFKRVPASLCLSLPRFRRILWAKLY